MIQPRPYNHCDWIAWLIFIGVLSPWPARITDLARDMDCTPDQVLSACARLQRRLDVKSDRGSAPP